MWIATNRGFLSVVTADRARLPAADKKALAAAPKVLCVRARKADHLRTLFPGKTVYQWKNRDYPARIFIANTELAMLMADEVLAIDYPNFKSSVKDDELHDAYLGVWGVMHRYQMGSYKRLQSYDPRQQSLDYGRTVDHYAGLGAYSGRPFNEQVPDDDDPCTTPGCTDLNPCLDCIIDAMGEDPRSEDELLDAADQKHDAQMADNRYGDFDTGDEADGDDAAESHRRIAP